MATRFLNGIILYFTSKKNSTFSRMEWYEINLYYIFKYNIYILQNTQEQVLKCQGDITLHDAHVKIC